MLKGKTCKVTVHYWVLKMKNGCPVSVPGDRARNSDSYYRIGSILLENCTSESELNMSQQFNPVAKEGNLVIWLHLFHSTGSYCTHSVPWYTGWVGKSGSWSLEIAEVGKQRPWFMDFILQKDPGKLEEKQNEAMQLVLGLEIYSFEKRLRELSMLNGSTGNPQLTTTLESKISIAKWNIC